MIIVRPIANVLFIIYGFIGDFGLAIILLTLLVKLCMWPLIKRQMDQTKLMRKIQPELAEIKKNCNGNRQLESLQMMDLYKRNNIKPFRSVITLIVQLPIFIALYTSVRVMVVPTISDNLAKRAYAPVRQIDRIEEVVQLQEPYLASLAEYQEYQQKSDADKEGLEPVAEPVYDFHPKLAGLVELDAKPGLTSVSRVIILLFAIGSALTQFWISRQQLPSKQKGAKTFRQILQEAADGKEPDQNELNQVMTGQMSFMMPAMMLLIMINLPGALVFYYCISNILTGLQQRFLLNKKTEDMEISADKRIIRELKHMEEGQIVSEPSSGRWQSNKNSTKSEGDKPGVKITRISAKSRKSHKKKRS